MKAHSAIATITMLLLPNTGQAIIPAVVDCDLAQTATVNININYAGSDIVALRDSVNDEMDDAGKLAKAAGIGTLEFQSITYTINEINPDRIPRPHAQKDKEAEFKSQYALNGNVYYIAKPGEKSAEFMALLEKKGYQVSVSVNGGRGYNYSCGQSPVPPPPPPPPPLPR